MTNHSEMVRKLFKDPNQIGVLSPGKVNLLHASVGVAGEAGEVLDRIKKYVFNNNDTKFHQQMINEIGDLEFYLEALRQSLGVTRAQCLQANVEKLAARYPNFEYSDAAAVRRADKEHTDD